MGHSREEHDDKVNLVMSILEKHGLTAEYSKCKFTQQNVSYLGHAVSSRGISPKPELLEAITKSPIPNNKDDIRSFLGLAEF